MRYRDVVLVAAFGVGHIVLFTLAFGYGNQVFFDQASAVLGGKLPYRDFVFEYPPLALLALLPPRLFASEAMLYGRLFSLEMLLLDLAVLALVALTARNLKRSVFEALLVYSLAIVALGSLSAERYEMLPVAAVAAALYAMSRGNNVACWVALGLGTAAKLYPILLAPLLVLRLARSRDFKSLAAGVAAFTATLFVVVVPWLALSPRGFGESLSYQVSRGLHIESTYAAALLVGRDLGFGALAAEFRYGAIELVSPLADRLAEIAAVLAPLALAAVYFWGGRFFTASQNDRYRGHLDDVFLAFSAAVITAFLVTGKVLSPQFLLWLLPAVVLVGGSRRWHIWGVFLLACALSQVIFPVMYFDLMDFKPLAVAVLVLRNGLLVVLALMLVRAGRRLTADGSVPHNGGSHL